MSWSERGRSNPTTPVTTPAGGVGPFRLTRHIHFVAIGGIGMSGIAEVLCNLGYRVTGTDLADSETTRRLTGLGAQIHRGHLAEHLDDADVGIDRAERIVLGRGCLGGRQGVEERRFPDVGQADDTEAEHGVGG